MARKFYRGLKYQLKSDPKIVAEYLGNSRGKGDNQYGEESAHLVMSKPHKWDLVSSKNNMLGSSSHVDDETVGLKEPTQDLSFDTPMIPKEIRTFDTGANRNSDEGKLDFEGFLSPTVLKKYAEYMHAHRYLENGDLRDSDNWQKGIPIEAYMKSMYRHFFDVWSNYRGLETEEDQVTNLCSVMFNAMGMLHEILKEDKNE